MLFIILLILQTSFHQSCLIIITIFIRTNSTWFEKRLFLVWDSFQPDMENCTLLYEVFSSADSGKVRIQNSAQGIRNPANYWNPESKFHWQGIRNPRSSDMDSGIPYHDRNPDFRQLGIQNPRLSWKYLTLGEKKSDIHSLLKVHLDFGAVFGTDKIWISVPKEVTPVAFSEAPTASQSCAQISLWLMVKSAVGDLRTRLTYLFPRPLARGKQRAHVLSTLWVST